MAYTSTFVLYSQFGTDRRGGRFCFRNLLYFIVVASDFASDMHWSLGGLGMEGFLGDLVEKGGNTSARRATLMCDAVGWLVHSSDFLSPLFY